MNPKGGSKESKDLEKSQGYPKETLKDNNKHDLKMMNYLMKIVYNSQ